MIFKGKLVFKLQLEEKEKTFSILGGLSENLAIEINNPPKALFVRNTRFSNTRLAVKLNNYRTNVFANSFIPMTSRDWNSLSAAYNFQMFKTHIHRFSLLLLLSRWRGQSGALGMHLRDVTPSRVNIIKN